MKSVQVHSQVANCARIYCKANRLPILMKAAAILLLLISARSNAAIVAEWLTNPVDGNWNDNLNWSPRVPNGPSDGAFFEASSITNVSITANTEVAAIVFASGASAFTITAARDLSLTISGNGITNNSGQPQHFVTVDGNPEGIIVFTNSATAGNGTFTNNGGTVALSQGGVTDFASSSTAGNGTFTNNGGTTKDAIGGITEFVGTPTASSGTFINNGGLFANGGLGEGGSTWFLRDSTGGTARVEVFGNGNLDISGHNLPGVTIGSIEGSGNVLLGANNLTVGSNNLSKTLSGVIQDGGIAGGTVGSLTKIGTGKLSLSKPNTYTGGTTLNKGTLLVKNAIGSATGSGAVQVNAGTLEGVGKVDGAVTVGTGAGTTSKANLLAGNSNTSPGTLTINNAVTFQSDSTYKCVLNRSTGKASKLTAFGVTINNSAQFTFADIGTGTLATGTVFRVIDNTSNLPISGRFRNLSNGLVLTSNGTNFKVSYTGGTGNDLTLKVVP
jgi:autotransporter-associated beta strand protein